MNAISRTAIGLERDRKAVDARHLVHCPDPSDPATPHRVHRDAYVDPAVFEAEIDRIFGTAWVYVGHESEVRESGCFMTTTIGNQPVILVRSQDGEIRVLFNRCTHRAATVCQERRGRTTFFRCPYHAWTFRPDGTLGSFAFPDGYDDPGIKREDYALGRVPRVDSYRGFIFASLAATGPSLIEHLGNAAPYIDLFADLSPTGRFLVGKPGEHRYSYRGNWKTSMENSVDGYHTNFVHSAFLEEVAPNRAAFRTFASKSPCTTVDLGNGHSLLDIRQALGDVLEVKPTKTAYGQAHKAALIERLGAERTREVFRSSGAQGWNLLVYPNLSFIQFHIRVTHPRAVDRTEVDMFPLLFDGGSAELNDERLRGHEIFYGPGGGGVNADLEVYHRVQDGLAAQSVEWLSFERGRNRTIAGANGELIGHASDEHPQRGFYRQWLADMNR